MENKNNKPLIFNLDINDEDETGINFISIVDVPAIQSQFVALMEAKQILKLSLDNDKMVLVGKVAIPDVPILQYDNESGDVYFIRLTKDNILKVAQKFARNAFLNNVNVMHTTEKAPAYIYEMWVVEDQVKDKSALYFDDVVPGTLMVKMQVTDRNYWNDYIKSGKFKGFSLEGQFIYKKSDWNINSDKQEDLEKRLENIQNQLDEILKKQKN